MDIDPSESLTEEPFGSNPAQHLFVPRDQCMRKRQQVAKNLFAVPDGTAGKLADNERMGQDGAVLEKVPKPAVVPAKVINPYGRIHKDHAARRPLRRGTALRLFSVPPRAARRLALSRAIKASSPIRTSDVFSATPVNLAALRSRESSMFSVVFIWVSMDIPSILVKGSRERVGVQGSAARSGL